MKIIRRLEELDGLENGKGLELIVLASPYRGCVWLKITFKNLVEIKDIENFDESDIKFLILKAMGFEFEWKPKKTLEEVFADYTEKPFEFGKDNYVIVDRGSGPRIERYSTTNFICAKYYSFEDAEKICEELNS